MTPSGLINGKQIEGKQITINLTPPPKKKLNKKLT